MNYYKEIHKTSGDIVAVLQTTANYTGFETQDTTFIELTNNEYISQKEAYSDLHPYVLPVDTNESRIVALETLVLQLGGVI